VQPCSLSYRPPARVDQPVRQPAAALPEEEGLYLPGHRGYPGITHPEYKNYIYARDYTCPHCGKTFKGSRIFQSRLISSQVQPDRYDLRKFYRDFQVEWYELVTCPRCCFTALAGIFLEPEVLKKERYQERLSQRKGQLKLDFETERDLDFVFAQHYLAMVCAHGLVDYRQVRARLWMNLSRLYEEAGDGALVQEAKARAADAYKEVYINCRLDPEREQRVCLTVAGLLFRAGDWAGAREWAGKARDTEFGKAVYTRMAKDLIDDAREQMRAEKGQR